MLYKNTSSIQKTFHGVTFQPGEIKEVPGYINDKRFVRVAEMPKEPPKRVDSAKSTTSKQEQPKKDPVKEEPKNNKKEEPVNGTNSD